MTIDQLRYFYEVAKCLNFSQAARTLYISQPNLTKYIANLEKELGFRLFDRSTHHCQLTEDGQQFMRSTEALFFQLNSHIENAKLRAHNPYHVVSVGIAQTEMPPHALVDCLNRRNTGERFRYLVREDNYLDLISKLRDYEVDLIVTTDKNVRNINDFDYLVLRPFEMLLVVCMENPKAQRKDLSPRDCADEMFFICIPEGKYTPLNRIEELYWKTGLRMNLCIVSSPADVILNAQVGAGVGIVPSTMDLTQHKNVCYYRFEPWVNSVQVLAWRKNETRPEILELVEEIRASAPFFQSPEVPIFGLPEDSFHTT